MGLTNLFQSKTEQKAEPKVLSGFELAEQRLNSEFGFYKYNPYKEGPGDQEFLKKAAQRFGPDAAQTFDQIKTIVASSIDIHEKDDPKKDGISLARSLYPAARFFSKYGNTDYAYRTVQLAEDALGPGKDINLLKEWVMTSAIAQTDTELVKRLAKDGVKAKNSSDLKLTALAPLDHKKLIDTIKATGDAERVASIVLNYDVLHQYKKYNSQDLERNKTLHQELLKIIDPTKIYGNQFDQSYLQHVFYDGGSPDNWAVRALLKDPRVQSCFLTDGPFAEKTMKFVRDAEASFKLESTNFNIDSINGNYDTSRRTQGQFNAVSAINSRGKEHSMERYLSWKEYRESLEGVLDTAKPGQCATQDARTTRLLQLAR